MGLVRGVGSALLVVEADEKLVFNKEYSTIIFWTTREFNHLALLLQISIENKPKSRNSSATPAS